jgi:hypothetical protein
MKDLFKANFLLVKQVKWKFLLIQISYGQIKDSLEATFFWSTGQMEISFSSNFLWSNNLTANIGKLLS